MTYLGFRPLLSALLLAALAPILETHAFHDGDFIQTARKAQYHQSRTQWHDLLGHHCPRFGIDRLVAVPLTKPKLPFNAGVDEYKIQLSFDGDRLMTPWLLVMGKRAPDVPVVDVTLRRSGEELLGVTAQVRDAPSRYKDRHPALMHEFRNASHWPKHVLVHYTFATENDIDLDRGLYALFALGLLMTLVLSINAVRGMKGKLAQFLQDMAAEEPGASSSGGPIWKGGAKAE